MTVKNTDILLVEDNLADARLVLEALKESGFECNIHTVNTGTNALDFLNQSGKYEKLPNPDLILLDIHLPDITGLELLKEIKTHSIFKIIPVVIFTNSNDSYDINNAYNNYVNAYLVKPFTYEEYLVVLRSLMAIFGFKYRSK